MTLADRLTYLLAGSALVVAGTLGGLWLVGIRAGEPARAALGAGEPCGCGQRICAMPCSSCSQCSPPSPEPQGIPQGAPGTGGVR